MNRPFWYLRRPKGAIRAEIDEEIGVHLEMRIAELRAQGLSADDARCEARRQFGDMDEARRYCLEQDKKKDRRMHLGLSVLEMIEDLRVSLRGLTRAPLMTLTIVLTVGLGIGATTAIFGGVRAALLKPLPYTEPERLYRLFIDAPPNQWRFSVADYQALEAQQTSFERVAHYTGRTMSWTDGSNADLLTGRGVSWTYFGVVGITPIRGRDFGEADGRPGAPPTVILSHGLWQSRFGGRDDVVGKSMKLDGTDHQIIGVLPSQVGPLEQRQEFFVVAQFGTPPRRGPFFYTPIAKLKPGVDPAAAVTELKQINARIFPIWRASYQDDKATWNMMDLKTFVIGRSTSTATVTLIAVGLVWLIACVNASSLLLARVTSRRRELAVRAALGASRGRVTKYLLAESAILAAGAVGIGVLLAWAGVRLLQTAAAPYFPRTQEIALDGPVIAVMMGLAAMSLLIFGLVPALAGGRGSLDESLRAANRSSTGSLTVRRLRRALVSAQFAIATPLLVVATLLLVSLARLNQVDIGFETHNVLTGSVRAPASALTAPAPANGPGALDVFWDDLGSRIAAIPGVSRVAFASGRPPAGVGNHNNFDLEDSPAGPGQSQPVAPWLDVTPDYFSVLGLQLLEGRLLTEQDALRPNLESIVVDRAWARRYFGQTSAVGKRLRGGGCTTCPWTTVVGVVSEVKYDGLDAPDRGSVYAPMAGYSTRFIFVRTERDPGTMVSSLRETIKAASPTAPLTSVATIDELVQQSLESKQSLSFLVAAFAGVALVLAIVGIYGVMSYFVQQHARDISIRMALGGDAGAVLRLVLTHAMRIVVAGVAVGLFAGYGVAQMVSTMLFGVGSSDPATYAAVSALMIVVAVLACYMPARRAVGLDPAQVLRSD
ncbi:MAG TPA: ABC transporter permease [Vicinamibacterales bacterium]|nr:ABC transporter permease [Vicinamibacterales bacterium]